MALVRLDEECHRPAGWLCMFMTADCGLSLVNVMRGAPAGRMALQERSCGGLKGVKLVPFFKSVLVYFVVLPAEQAEQSSWTGVLVKVMPVLSLVLFVWLHEDMSLRDGFSRRVLTALSLSALADALLVSHFLAGMAVFGAAHVFYIAALGFRPLRPALGCGLYALSAWVMSFLVPGLEGPLLLGVPLYTVVLVTMLWRALAHQQETPGSTRWCSLLPGAGGLLFAVSDTIIGFHMFHKPIPHSQVLIMATYFAAQLGMALSVVGRNCKASKD